MRELVKVTAVVVAVLCAVVMVGAQSVGLNQVTRPGTISANGDSVELTASALGGGIGSVKVQTFDSYSGTWEVQCSVDGTTYDTASELKLTPADSTTVAYSVTDTVAIWDVGNAAACQKIRVIATAGFAASDVYVAITATQSGGSSSGGGGVGGGTSDTTEATQLQVLTAVNNVDSSAAGTLTNTGTTATNTGTIAGTVSSSRVNINIATINGNTPTADATADFDSSGSTQTRSMIGLMVAASGGGVALEGTLANGLEVDVTRMAALVAGTALIGRVQIDAQAGNGYSPIYYTSAGSTEDEHNVCSAACNVGAIVVTNTNAAARYLRCANIASTGGTTPGSSTIIFGPAIPGNTAGAGYAVPLPASGLSMSTGLTCWIVTGPADSDVAEVASNEVKVFYAVKQ